jgi:tetratricopeptide (TPR) repeat protein
MNALQDAANQLIRLQPGAPEGYSLRALSSMNVGRYSDAERDITRALEIAPQSAYGYVELGNLRLLQKQYPEASAAYQKALDRNPGSIDALRGLVNVDLAGKQLDQAAARIQSQIAKSPGNSSFYSLLGTVLVRKKEFDTAQAALQKAIALDQHNSDAWTQLCEAQASEGKLDQAISTDQQALKVLGARYELYLLLGSFYESTSTWNKAEDAYQKALAISPLNAVASNDLARVIVQAGGDSDAALSLAQTAHRALPESPGVVDTLGWIYYEKGAYSLAVTYLQQALDLQQQRNLPENPDIYYHLGLAYEKTKQPALARQEFERVLQINPNYRGAPEVKSELTHL